MAAGKYTLTIFVPGLNRAVVTVLVDQLDQVVPVTLNLGAIEGPSDDCAIYGHVAGEADVLYVRLAEILGSRFVDVPLAPDRGFDFRHVTCTSYLLVLVGRDSCIGTLAVTARHTTGALRIAAPRNSDSCVPLTLEK
jgi:hypothetical protein